MNQGLLEALLGPRALGSAAAAALLCGGLMWVMVRGDAAWTIAGGLVGGLAGAVAAAARP